MLGSVHVLVPAGLTFPAAPESLYALADPLPGTWASSRRFLSPRHLMSWGCHSSLPVPQTQVFSNLAQQSFRAGQFFVVRCYPGHCRLFGSFFWPLSTRYQEEFPSGDNPKDLQTPHVLVKNLWLGQIYYLPQCPRVVPQLFKNPHFRIQQPGQVTCWLKLRYSSWCSRPAKEYQVHEGMWETRTMTESLTWDWNKRRSPWILGEFFFWPCWIWHAILLTPT